MRYVSGKRFPRFAGLCLYSLSTLFLFGCFKIDKNGYISPDRSRLISGNDLGADEGAPIRPSKNPLSLDERGCNAAYARHHDTYIREARADVQAVVLHELGVSHNGGDVIIPLEKSVNLNLLNADEGLPELLALFPPGTYASAELKLENVSVVLKARPTESMNVAFPNQTLVVRFLSPYTPDEEAGQLSVVSCFNDLRVQGVPTVEHNFIDIVRITPKTEL